MIQKIKYITVTLMVLSLFCGNICFARSEDANLTYHPSQMFDIYANKGVYASAVYNGNLENATCIDNINGIYSNNYGYNNGYNGYFMYDRDEVVSVFGESSDEFERFDASGADYFCVNRDFALRHEKDIADADGVKKDTWFTTRNKRFNTASDTVDIQGFMYFRITNRNIVSGDTPVTLSIEYLDSHPDGFYVRYCNTEGKLTRKAVTTEESGKWKTVRVILDNADISTSNSNTALASGNEAVLGWNEYTGDNFYSYRVFCDGRLVATTTEPSFVHTNLTTGVHKWYVEVYDDMGELVSASPVVSHWIVLQWL